MLVYWLHFSLEESTSLQGQNSTAEAEARFIHKQSLSPTCGFFSCERTFTPGDGSPDTNQRHGGFSSNGGATPTICKVGAE